MTVPRTDPPDRRKSDRRTFVLVHGGGHGGWCWQRLARELRDHGHDVWTPTLTGFGERGHLGGPDTPFETFVTDVVAVLDFEDLHDVVLVGHSMGGVVVPRVAEARPDRIARVVWLAAVVTGDGETLLQAVPQTPEIARAVTIEPDGTARTDHRLMAEILMPEGTDADRAWVADRHRPYPPAALVQPGRLTAFLELRLPTAYVTATKDAAIPPPLARTFASRLPGAHTTDVDAGHDLMITRPAETAEALLAVTS
ncbi:MAG: alpha/beta fold hydrolase [Streptomycetaceae bacterium]|nr:alpha/beta fold hydrolase [Streptomycetaceae bacterium]